MNPFQNAAAASVLRRLDAVAITGRELVIGGLLMLLVLLLTGALTWKTVAIAFVWAGASAGAVAYLRWRRALQAEDRRQYYDGDAASNKSMDDRTLQAMLSGLPDAAIVLDGRLAVRATNEAARDLFSIVPGRHIAQNTRAPELLRAVDVVLEQRIAQSLQLRLTPPLERTLAVRVTPLAAHEASGRHAILIVLQDMTEQERLSRMRADFVAYASHELRTPLASLKGFIETLQGAAKDDPAVHERFLAIMQEQASRMSRLIEDLLSLSRIEMREHVAPSGDVDLSVIVDEVTKSLRPLADQASIGIDMKSFTRPVVVIGDRDELAQVIQNLIQNAIKYGRAGGKIDVTLAPDGQRISLTVKDNGIGIAPHHLPRLTERFYRVSAKESRERGGTGLGLAIAKHIVNRHRGELRIASVLGQGSTFTVLLPAATGHQ